MSAITCTGTNQNQSQVFDNIKTEVAFRHWNQKGLGKITEHNEITVVKSVNSCGDIVLLRWTEDKSQFQAEIYRADSCTKDLSEWQLVSSSEEKTLTEQHGQYFLILELIPGENGGQKTERFALPYQKNQSH